DRPSSSRSRLIPDGVHVNQEAVDFYNDMFDELQKNDIEPIVNLYHFDMPLNKQNKGGWENLEVVEAFKYYAETAFKLFGHKIKKWTTFNAPIAPVEMGYLNYFHYPCLVDMKRAVFVAYNSMIASVKTFQAYYELNQVRVIGIILNLTPSYPRSESE